MTTEQGEEIVTSEDSEVSVAGCLLTAASVLPLIGLFLYWLLFAPTTTDRNEERLVRLQETYPAVHVEFETGGLLVPPDLKVVAEACRGELPISPILIKDDGDQMLLVIRDESGEWLLEPTQENVDDFVCGVVDG